MRLAAKVLAAYALLVLAVIGGGYINSRFGVAAVTAYGAVVAALVVLALARWRVR